MSNEDKDIKDSSIYKDLADAEFDAFLQGGDELALLLQELPQDAPSAELDAAVMADAALVLAVATVNPPAVSAANDAKNPDASAHRPSFLWRWKVPLGLAASILFASPFLLLHKQAAHNESSAVVSASPAKPFADMPQLAKAEVDMADKNRLEVKPQAESVAAPTVAENLSKGAISPTPDNAVNRENSEASAKKTSFTGRSNNTQVVQAPKQAEPAGIASRPASAIIVAQLEPPEAAPVIITGSKRRSAEMSSSIESVTILSAQKDEAKIAEAGPDASRELARDSRAKAVAVREEVTHQAKAGETAKPQLLEAEKSQISARKEMETPPPAAPMAVVRSAPVAAAPPAMPMEKPGSMDWLQKIEKLLKEKQHQDALEEWKKFRATYPNFVVDKSLQKQIDALQK